MLSPPLLAVSHVAATPCSSCLSEHQRAIAISRRCLVNYTSRDDKNARFISGEVIDDADAAYVLSRDTG